MFIAEEAYAITQVETGKSEVNFLTSLPQFNDPVQRQELYAMFRRHYSEQLIEIRNKQEKVSNLILKLFSPDEVALFARNLERDADLWLDRVFKATELFHQLPL